ncbi:MAG: LamG domain-containing protein, partial [Burkholderiales bacterium]|nr:LamG domain-containing protein [Burkholderiales bacterium]
EGTGTVLHDVSGNGNNGTINNATWTTAGKYGPALNFNGTNAYVDLGNPTSLQFTGSMTVSAWIRTTAFPADDAAIVSKRSSNAIGFQLDTSVDTGPRTVGFKLASSTGALMARYSSTVLQANTWYYVTGVYDASARTMSVYVNGVLNNGALRGTVTATQQNSTVNVNVGRRTGAGKFNFNGTIDEVRIYNRALSATEIAADMNTAQ